MLHVHNVTVRRPSFTLGPITFEARRGEVVGILGPNGSGKSTLLQSLIALYPIDEGSVTIEGEHLQSLTANVRATYVSMLSQVRTSPFGYTVEDIVALGYYARQRSRPRSDEIDEMLRQFELLHLKQTPVQRLSGGELQRTYMAKVFAQRTPLVLFDEPTTYLDVRHRSQFFEHVEALRRMGRTSIIILHDLNEAMQYCDEVLVLHEGRQCAIGAPERVLTLELIQRVYGITPTLVTHPKDGSLRFL